MHMENYLDMRPFEQTHRLDEDAVVLEIKCCNLKFI